MSPPGENVFVVVTESADADVETRPGLMVLPAHCSEHGLPAPAFEEVGTHFRVTFRLKPGTGVLMDDISRRMLMAIKEKGQLSTRAVAEAVGLSTRAARTRLKALVDRGLIGEVGSGPTDPKRVYVPIR